MKLQLTLVSLAGALAAAAPVVSRSGVSDTADDWSDIIAGKSACANVAVIFARGTFDSGNIGVWVGPQFFDALKSKIPGVALVGVDPNAYPADLEGYLSETGGSNKGASSMAQSIIDYSNRCPGSAIVASGWSQGAIVAHKALDILQQTSAPALERVSGLVTFGDPNHVWDNIPLPKSIPSTSFSSSCVTGTILDPLCADLPNDFKVPSSVFDFIGAFEDLPSIAVGLQQTEAAGSLILSFPGQLLENFSSFVKTLAPSQFIRLLLTPQHFTYGDNGMAETAAEFASKLAIAAPREILNIAGF